MRVGNFTCDLRTYFKEIKAVVFSFNQNEWCDNCIWNMEISQYDDADDDVDRSRGI